MKIYLLCYNFVVVVVQDRLRIRVSVRVEVRMSPIIHYIRHTLQSTLDILSVSIIFLEGE